MNRDEAIDFVDVMEEVVKQTINITCIVYLRSQCKECILNGLEKELQDKFMPKNDHWIEEDTKQFFRQLVIFTKDYAEKRCQEECTADTLLKAIFGEQVEL